jgi:hypothetical protein
MQEQGKSTAPDSAWAARAGALSFGLAGLMSLPALFSVHPPTDPAHNRAFALGANTASYRVGTALAVYAFAFVILGTFALYGVLSQGGAPRWATAGLVMTVVGGCLLLPGTAYSIIVMPAAGILISQGHEQDVLRLLDQMFKEPAFLVVLLGGIVYTASPIAVGLAVWRSGTMSRWAALLLVFLGLVEVPAFLDLTVAQAIQPAAAAAAYLATAAALWKCGPRLRPDAA